MTEGEKIFWAAVGALAVTVLGAVILGIPRLLAKRRNDRVSLRAGLTVAGDAEVVGAVGCACLVLTVACTSKRAAKIRGAFLALEGDDFLSAFQKGFQSGLGHVPPEKPPRQSLVVDLIPASKPNSQNGFVLQRDDVCRFLLPIRVPCLPMFAECAPKDVSMGVVSFDGAESVVLQGTTVQDHVKALMQMWGDAIQTLNVPVSIRVKVTSRSVPKLPDIVGKTNPAPVEFREPQGDVLGKGPTRTGP